MSLFTDKAPAIMLRLMSEFKLTLQSAAAILGNLGHESAGFTAMQEIRPVNGGRGGFGWAQWTGPRRRSFEAYCQDLSLDPRSDEANLGFLVKELKTTHQSAIRNLNAEPNLQSAVMRFEREFERADPRYKHYDRRVKYAQIALQAYERAVTPPTTELKPSRG